MWVVVVVIARSPRATISRASRNIAVVFPPPPTSETTSPTPIPSAPAKVTPGSGRGLPSAARSRRRALDQLLGAGLDPRKEARHHHAHAQAGVALDVAGVDQGAGHAARLDDLLDRAVD